MARTASGHPPPQQFPVPSTPRWTTRSRVQEGRGDSWALLVQLSDPYRVKQEVGAGHGKVLPHPSTLHPCQDTEQRRQDIHSQYSQVERLKPPLKLDGAPHNLRASFYFYLCFFSTSSIGVPRETPHLPLPTHTFQNRKDKSRYVAKNYCLS